ncbi:MAG: hypothetical protein KAW14_06165 [Candidatus Aegiribacteria sp.]|nr:hypothetical protein [Candidatus Aegiribacteria sp.]
MKLFIFALVIVAASVFAVDADLGNRHAEGNGMVSIDGLVYSQTYDYAELINGYSNYGAGDRWVCDDFELSGPEYYFDYIYVWMIWTGGMGSTMNFVFSEDNGDSDPNTSTDVWGEAVPCTNEFTGDTNWGYDIYKTTCNINETDTWPELEIGTHYWFETQADVTDNCFILVGTWGVLSYTWYNDGSGVWVRSDIMFGEGTDMFFDFYYSWNVLESSTWADIKTLF